MSESVSNEIRDSVMENIILADNQNHLCFDCGSKEPKWASPYLGIIICYECAARHRSYGAHISFVRSINLDKWNRRQLKSLEITGNEYTKEKFIEMGIPKKGSFFDYESDLVLKYRAQLEEKVREILDTEHSYLPQSAKKEEQKVKKEEVKEEEKVVEEKPKEPEIKEPTKLEIKKTAKVNVKVEGKAGKKNKIKKVDFDFDFDSFNDVNFAELNKKEEDEEKDNHTEEPKEDKELEEEEKKVSNSQSYNIKLSKDEVNKKFANKKAISSEDYAALEDNGNQDSIYSQRIKSMGGSQAISSSDVYGTNDNDYYEGESLTEKMKDFAINFTLKAAEKAKELKNKTNEMLSKVQNKLGGNNY